MPASTKIATNGVKIHRSTRITDHSALVDDSQSNVLPSPRTWLRMPNCGLNISFQITPAMTGAIISGRISTFSNSLPIIDDRLSSSARPTPSTVSMPVATIAKITVTLTLCQKIWSPRTDLKLSNHTKCGSGLTAA